MKSYATYASEKRSFTDRVSGAEITQLTSYLGHSWHAYFTNNGWWDGGRRLLIRSDRENAANLFSIELESGEISRLTDFPAGAAEHPNFSNDVNPARPEVYYTYLGGLYALDLLTLRTRLLYTCPGGFTIHGGLVGADGRHVYTAVTEDLSKRVYTNMGAGYIGMRETFLAHPDCRIVQIDTENGGGEEIWQENTWVGHVNPSPARPDLLSFCHEGPWQLVDHRIWVMDLKTGAVAKVRERRAENEMVGHEYWHLDGEHIGYQVHRREEGKSFFGAVKYDGTEEREAPCVPMPSPDHIHSNDFSLIASDSGKCVKLYRNNGGGFDPARVLCMHDGCFFFGSHHPHPRFTADGKRILYNSDASGYCQVYLAQIPEDITTLPYLEM